MADEQALAESFGTSSAPDGTSWLVASAAVLRAFNLFQLLLGASIPGLQKLAITMRLILEGAHQEKTVCFSCAFDIIAAHSIELPLDGKSVKLKSWIVL